MLLPVKRSLLKTLLCLITLNDIVAFDNGKILNLPYTSRITINHSPLLSNDQRQTTSTELYEHPKSNIFNGKDNNDSDRRNFIQSLSSKFVLLTGASSLFTAEKVLAAEEEPSRPSLPSLLYTILRAREATAQESRLIATGKFKDVQRANVKLAVTCVVKNYRLSDTFIQASAYLNGNKRMQAGEAGQSAVQTLYTILEYFDSSDVQNIKVGGRGDMDGKERLVLKGLEAARTRMDEFLAFFPEDEVKKVRLTIVEENELNAREFDPALGVIVNPNPKV